MMIVWSLVAVSGVLLWLAPHGPRSGYRVLLLDLTKREWGELHTWFSFIAIAITVAHLIIDWRRPVWLYEISRQCASARHRCKSRRTKHCVGPVEVCS